VNKLFRGVVGDVFPALPYIGRIAESDRSEGAAYG
jgi:hypothetical protein